MSPIWGESQAHRFPRIGQIFIFLEIYVLSEGRNVADILEQLM